jgi:magnesium-transporting ATPase (P-type)
MEIIPPFFGIMGVFLTIIFFATVWYWMKCNEIEDGELRKAARWRMTGHSLLLMATWFTCGIFSYPGFALRPEKADYQSAIAISYVVMILLVLGFIFVFLGQRKAYLTKLKSLKTAQRWVKSSRSKLWEKCAVIRRRTPINTFTGKGRCYRCATIMACALS